MREGEKQAAKQAGAKTAAEKRPVRPLELYLHIPFCARKCLYCDFLSFPAGEDVRGNYVDKLVAEIEACGKRPAVAGRRLASVFVGGGTPSLLTEKQTERLLEAVRRFFGGLEGAEVTIEANPGTCRRELLSSWKQAGINRLSLGLQSLEDRELQALGRIHRAADFLESFHLARECGFDNINVDLMSALPGQTAAGWEETLSRAAALGPEHISAYSLIIEEGTPFYERYGAMSRDLERYGEWEAMPAARRSRYRAPFLPGEEEERRMYARTREILEARGYRRYEISNYARPGRECLHNVGYWTGTDYLGLGLGAASLLEGERFSVTASLEEYLGFSGADFFQGRQYGECRRLTRRERMEEFMFLGLRLIRGVYGADFAARFGVALESVYGKQLEELCREGLLFREPAGAAEGCAFSEAAGAPGDRAFSEAAGAPESRALSEAAKSLGSWRYALTPRGLDVSNYALAKFLLDGE